MNKEYDIIIIGAGLVGCSLVNALDGLGLSIAVIDRKLPDWSDPVVQDERPLSLSCGSQRVLQTLGLWQKLEAKASPIRSMQLSYQGHLGSVNFVATDYDLAALGYVVPYHLLYQKLYQQAHAQSAVTMLESKEIMAITNQGASTDVTFELHNGVVSTVRGRLLVACDGARSVCRDQLAITIKEHDTGDWAHLFQLAMQQSHHGDAHQRWTNAGSLAMLPLFDVMQRRMVWTMDKAMHSQVSAWDDKQLIDYIQQVFQLKIGAVNSIKPVGQYPLTFMQASQHIAKRCVLLGNAAHVVYPLTAQGYNLGLREVAWLAQNIADTLYNQEDIGSDQMLSSYQNQVSKDQRFVSHLTQQMYFACGLDVPLIKPIRSLGLLAMDMLPFAKNKLAQRLMGLSGNMSRLACGIPLVAATQQER